MIFSSRMPKEKRFEKPKNKRNKFTNKLPFYNKKLILRDTENLTHTELRELQRYGTQSVNKKEVVKDILNDRAIIINRDSSSVIALVRHTNRYYVAVMDIKINVIKTFLPDSICNFMEYVKQFVEKENLKIA